MSEEEKKEKPIDKEPYEFPESPAPSFLTTIIDSLEASVVCDLGPVFADFADSTPRILGQLEASPNPSLTEDDSFYTVDLNTTEDEEVSQSQLEDQFDPQITSPQLWADLITAAETGDDECLLTLQKFAATDEEIEIWTPSKVGQGSVMFLRNEPYRPALDALRRIAAPDSVHNGKLRAAAILHEIGQPCNDLKSMMHT